jgi:hypothetical protein
MFMYHTNGSYDTVSYTEEIIKDTIINKHKYYVFLRSQNLPWAYFPGDTGVVFYRRTDSTSIYRYNASMLSEDTIVNFNDTVGTVYNENFKDTSGNVHLFRYSISIKYTLPVFGKYYPSIFMAGGIIYASKLFMIAYQTDGMMYGGTISLMGAMIDGVYYGDSTTLSVNSQLRNKTIASDYALYQNYPDPFNPSTTISFTIPARSAVTMKIYDILGKEVATIVSQELPAGTYSRQWNAAKMSSGIYFYRLQAGSFTQTKRLVLLK